MPNTTDELHTDRMGLFSFFRKNQQESSAGDSDFYSQADEQKPALRKRRERAKRDEPVDPVLPEKKRARRRLVGAIALVLAAIIGLPMILDSEPKPLADDIAIQIPSKDNAAPFTRGKPVIPDQTLEQQAAEAAALGPNEQFVQPAGPVAPETVLPDPKEMQKPQVDVAKSGKAESRPAAPSTTSKSSDDARAQAILEGKSTAVATPAVNTSGKVSLQVAALATQEKVSELQKKLQGAGLKSYTQKVATASGERIRVRIGPFANDAEAETARAKLVKLGLTGKLVPA